MKKASIMSCCLYAVTGADRLIVPSLILDNALWDRLPEAGEIIYQPTPAGSRWSTILDRDTGARRGILAVLPRPGTIFTKGTVEDLKALGAKARELGVPESGTDSVAALQDSVEDPLILDVVRDSRVIMPWETYVSGDQLHPCPLCGERVAMNAANRLRAHLDETGASCSRSNTRLSEEEKNNEQ